MGTKRKEINHNIEAFFALLKAGLWNKEARLSPNSAIEYADIMKLVEEQS